MPEQEIEKYRKALEDAYTKALEEVWEDGVKTAKESLKLKELREKYYISAEEHLKLEEEVVAKLKAKKQKAKNSEEVHFSSEEVHLKSTHVLDVETFYLSHELPRGWKDIHKMRITCCVIYDPYHSYWKVFTEPKLPDTLSIDELYAYIECCKKEGCTLIGHNIINFDWKVIKGEFQHRGYINDWAHYRSGKINFIDTLQLLHNILGYRISLEKLANLNLKERKMMNGYVAIKKWREGFYQDVIQYCMDDVSKTYRIWKIGHETGRILVETLFFGLIKIYKDVRW